MIPKIRDDARATQIHPLFTHGKFQIEDVKPIMDHTRTAEKWMAKYSTKKEPKIKTTGNPHTRFMENYYRTKSPLLDVLENPLQETVSCDTTRSNLRLLSDFTQRKTEELGPCAWDKQKSRYVPMTQFNQSKIATVANFACDGRIVYEFSSKALQN